MENQFDLENKMYSKSWRSLSDGVGIKIKSKNSVYVFKIQQMPHDENLGADFEACV